MDRTGIVMTISICALALSLIGRFDTYAMREEIKLLKIEIKGKNEFN